MYHLLFHIEIVELKSTPWAGSEVSQIWSLTRKVFWSTSTLSSVGLWLTYGCSTIIPHSVYLEFNFIYIMYKCILLWFSTVLCNILQYFIFMGSGCVDKLRWGLFHYYSVSQCIKQYIVLIHSHDNRYLDIFITSFVVLQTILSIFYMYPLIYC